MLPKVFFTAVLIFLFMFFIARPVAVFAVLLPFKAKLNQCLLVSFAGLRGAASIVFAIMVITGGAKTENDIFNIVFLIAIISVALQGSLLPFVTKKLDMVAADGDVRKTFNDYVERSWLNLINIAVTLKHKWAGKLVKDIDMPTDFLILSVRRNGEVIYPRGDTKLEVGDSLIVSVPAYNDTTDVSLKEIKINKRHKWKNKTVSEISLPKKSLVAAIKRGDEFIIPNGESQILENDVLILCE